MLGRYVYTYLKLKNYDVAGLSRSEIDASCISSAELKSKLTDTDLSEGDVIINCMGIIKREDVPKIDFTSVNTIFPHTVAYVCESVGAELLHVSTDCVYDGLEGNYDENHIHTADDLYGMSKSGGEVDNATVIRTSLIGEEVGQSRSLIEWIKSNANKTVNGYTNHVWNGITCLQFAKLCDDIIENGLFWRGVKHIISPSKITKHDLVKLISDVYELNINVMPHETEIKCDRSLSSVRGELIFKIPELREQLIEMKSFTLDKY
jgi:dTDP-4-dehydrorhamnose reductase